MSDASVAGFDDAAKAYALTVHVAFTPPSALNSFLAVARRRSFAVQEPLDGKGD